MTSEQRFWKKVQKTNSCWLWMGSSCVYGHLTINYKSVYAHRFSWEIHFGPIPKNLCVLHRCDNPLCVNPNHLLLGTHRENMVDRDKKGRQAKHERSENENLSKPCF